MRVAVTRIIPESGLNLLREQAEVALWREQLPPSPGQLLDLAEGAAGMLTTLNDRIDGDVLDRLPQVRVVSNYAVGYDNIDVPACTSRNVAVCTTPDVLTDATADFAFTLMLATARRLVSGADAVRQGEWKTWEPMGWLGQSIAGATLGIIGLGRIGSAVAERARGFGMHTLYFDEYARPETVARLGVAARSLDDLLRESDIVTIHAPLTNETRGLIGARELQLMKRSAVLVNTARGPIIDTEALTEALQSGEIWAAGLDVTDPEPLPADHPLISLPNAVITPHIASATYETRAQMSRLAAENILAVLSGRTPPRCLNPEVLGRERG